MSNNLELLRYFLVVGITLLMVFSTTSMIFTSGASYNQNPSKSEEDLNKSSSVPDTRLKKSNDDKNETETLESDSEGNGGEELRVEYDESYRTLNYHVWRKDEYNNTYASNATVIRRGSTLELNVTSNADISIEASTDDMTPLEESNGTIDIPDDSTIGTYTIEAEGDGWEDSMKLFVIYDPWELGISEEERKAYAYDEESVRSELSYIYTTGENIPPATLRPFGDPRTIQMYEFALRAVSGVEDQREAAVRLLRIVAQRHDAVPSSFQDQPIIRDTSEILFGKGKTTLHGSEYDYTGLTLEDAEKLSINDESVPGIDGLTENGKSKIINGWCDETALAMSGLLRSIGIPSRVVSVHPDEEVTELMGHFMNEVYFEESLFDTSWDGDEGGWFVMDGDSWNAEWYYQDPTFWMPMGELYTSRENFNRAVETLFRVNYDYEVDNYYVPPFEIPSEIGDMRDITNKYKDDPHFELEYGSIEKYAGRGGGDYFRADVKETSKLSINRSGGTNPRLYVSQNEYPALKISYQGYPPEYPNGNLTDDEIILDEGIYYIGVYAPEVNDENLEGQPYEGYHLPEDGDPSLKGNYGKYELTLERAEGENPASEPEPISEADADLTDGTVELDWEVPDNGGSRINYYIIYRDGEQIAKVEDPKYLDEGVEKDKNYNYHITAVNFMGQSEKLEEDKISISTHEKPVYEENSLQFIVSILLLILWAGSYFGMKKIKRPSG